MSARKARFIRSINKSGDHVAVTLKDHDGSMATVTAYDLSRVELIRAASMVGCKSNGGWTTWSNDDLIGAINTAVVRDGRTHDYENTDHAKSQGDGDSTGAQIVTGSGDGDGDGEGESSGDGDSDGSGDGEAQGQGDGDGEAQGESQSSDDDDPLLAALRKFVHDNGIGQVKPEDVQAAVESAVDSLRPHNTTITLPDGTIKDVPGRQHDKFDILLTCVQRRLNAYLCGPPGTGKSYTTGKVAEALGLEYASLSLGPQTPESRLWGYYDANGNYVRTPFRDAYENGWVFCLDEMDNGHPGIIASMNQAVAGDGATFPDGWVSKHDSFVLVATANTFGTGPTAEFVGRNILDPATLDRFVTIEWPIDVKVERMMIDAWLSDRDVATKWHKALKRIRKNAESYRIKVVCSPRSAQDGAALLDAGINMLDVLDMRVFRGLSDDQKSKLLEGVEV